MHKHKGLFSKEVSKQDRILCWKVIKSLLPCNSYLVIACSGGLDSSVLAHAAAQHAKINFNKLLLVYVNHGLRPEENHKEIMHIEGLSQQYNAPYEILEAKIDYNRSGLQERARKVRYKALHNCCQRLGKDVTLLTAHNANDQAENVIFRTLTGRKNVYIPNRVNTVWGNVMRPFLHFSRFEIQRYATVFGLHWCEDSSNFTDKYTRNKIRHHLIPWIESNINPGVIKTLSRDY